MHREGAIELVNASPANTVHCEVDASSLGMNVHVCGTGQLYTRGGYGMKFHKSDPIRLPLILGKLIGIWRITLQYVEKKSVDY